MVLALFCELILMKLYRNVNYESIWDKLAFQPSRSKFKVTVAYGGGVVIV